MLYYIKCVNNKGYTTYYTGSNTANPGTWNSICYMRTPTFMHIFKAKQIINNMKILDNKIGEKDKYTYTIIPNFFHTMKNSIKK